MKVTRLFCLVAALFLTGCLSEAPSPESKVTEAPAAVEDSSTEGCRNDRDCGPGRHCCGGECLYVECCGNEDCSGRVCADGRCEPCEQAEDCGAGKVCCSGLCQDGGCCSSADCAQGQVCLGNTCQDCSYDGECGEGEKCCEGACVAGTCCSSGDCGSALCENNQCLACAEDAQCGEGQECCDGACVAEGACLLQGEMTTRSTCTPACGGKTPLCCNGSCVNGQCCSNADCQAFPSTPTCINYVCQKCTGDIQCASGQKCCGGACIAAECCPGQVCSNGQACLSNKCSACTKDTDCGRTGYRCCNGSCVQGTCCSNADCGSGGQLCVAGKCSACSYDIQCGRGKRCCGGACIALTACCSNSDCSNGQVCSLDSRTCVACAQDSQCASGQKCCGGTCKSATCCNDQDCQAKYPGYICGAGGTCQPCTNDLQCGGKGRCCSGSCVSGATCCADSDCAAGQQCINGGCGSCQTDPANPKDITGTCPRGHVCCGADGQKSCRPGTCCSTSDCATTGSSTTLVCTGNSCGACDDSEKPDPERACPAGSKCCKGVCTPGDCCDHDDCGCGAGRCGLDVAGTRLVCNSCKEDGDCGGGMQCCPSVDNASPTKVCKAFCETTKQYESAEEFDSGRYTNTQQGTYHPADSDCAQPGFVCVAPHVPASTLGSWNVVYDSQIVATSTAQPFWKRVNLRAKIPASATIEARVRVGKDAAFTGSKGWSDWSFVVPNGTGYADYSLDFSFVPKVNDAALRRFIEVEVRMKKTLNGQQTPVLQRLQIDWSPDDPLGPCTPCPAGSYRCGAGSCCPCKTCASEGRTCGDLDTRCGGSLDCGSCPEVAHGYNVCSQAGHCELLCHPGYHKVGNCCAADNCQTLGKNCGDWPDGCGGTLSCGALSTCPQPPNSTRFCNQGRCDFTCHDCYVKSRNQCPHFDETFTVKVSPSVHSIYVKPAGVTKPLYYTAGSVSAQATSSGHANGSMTNPITYSLVNQPSWLSVNPTTGLIQGTPTNNSSHPGTYNVTVRATTRCGSIASASLTVTVLRNQWCGDGVVSASHGEICDTQPKVCYSELIEGLPSYCTGQSGTQGEQACINECKGWGVCSAPPPDAVSNSSTACSTTSPPMNDFFCCALTSCTRDQCSCCGRSQGAPTPGGYSSQATMPPCGGTNQSCRMTRSNTNPRNWIISTIHTTAYFKCWR